MKLRSQDEFLFAHHKFKEVERKQMINDLPIYPGQKILDFGCGIGLWSEWLAKKRLQKSMFYNNIEYRVLKSSIFDLEIDFDLIFFANVLGYIPQYKEYLYKIIKFFPTGCIIAVKDIDARNMVISPFNPGLMGRIIDAIDKLSQNRCKNPAIYNGKQLDFFVGREIYSIFVRSGMKSIKTKSYLIERTQNIDHIVRKHIGRISSFWEKELIQYLSKEDIDMISFYFRGNKGTSVLDQPDFYYFDAEIMTYGII